MPSFSYKAKRGDGKVIKGSARAGNVRELGEHLAAQGLFLIDAAESVAKVATPGFEPQATPSAGVDASGRAVALEPAPRARGRRLIKRAKLIEFTSALATTYSAGISVLDGLKDIAADEEDERLTLALREVYTRINEGQELWSALAQTGMFPQLYIALIQSGERSGRLDTVLLEVTRFLEWQQQLAQLIRKASIYPASLFVAVSGLVILLLTVVFPALAGVFTGMQIELPWPTRVLLWLSDAATSTVEYWGTGLVVGALSTAIYVRTPQGVRTTHRLILRLPFFGNLQRKLLTSRFATNMSMLLASGVELTNALTLTSEVMINTVFRDAVLSVRDAVRNGSNLADATERTQVFPRLLVRMLRVGEQTGSADSTMQKVAQTYDREVPAAIQSFFAVVDPAILGFLGLVVGFLAMAVLMPLYQLQDAIR